jgi:hypothetical protein
VLGLIISRVIRPTSKLSTLASWADSTLGVDLDVAGASTDEVYAAMDWLADRQEAIEKKLAAKHLGPEVNPSRMALFDLTSSWVPASSMRRLTSSRMGSINGTSRARFPLVLATTRDPSAQIAPAVCQLLRLRRASVPSSTETCYVIGSDIWVYPKMLNPKDAQGFAPLACAAPPTCGTLSLRSKGMSCCSCIPST